MTNLIKNQDASTFRVVSSGAKSVIDHVSVSESLYDDAHTVAILDSGINLSNHRPVAVVLSIPSKPLCAIRPIA